MEGEGEAKIVREGEGREWQRGRERRRGRKRERVEKGRVGEKGGEEGEGKGRERWR